VEGGYLREATTDWDVVDGRIVAENPACGAVPDAAPPSTVEIATVDGPMLTAEQMLAGMSDEQVARLGSVECAREFSRIVTSAERYVTDLDEIPTGFEDLVDAGYLAELPTLWQADGDELVPVEGGGCNEIGDTPASDTLPADDCTTQAWTLAVAVEAYRAMNGDDAPVTEAALVEGHLLLERLALVDLDADGSVVWAPGSGCEGFALP